MAPAPQEIVLKPIGVIHTPFKQPKSAPAQPDRGKDVEGTVEVFPDYADGLQNIERFSHLVLIYHFHLSKGYSLRRKRFTNEEQRGVFATRAPSRPNAIGISVVRLNRVDDNILQVRDLDIVDGTPLLDIKPHSLELDSPTPERTRWL